ncbi:MAG TPA: hypothetical protein VKA26_08665 [Ignavibacteriaceae bacterium]|nr:hypothetical protein [Ignavibacteriaceae bacterium]
MPNKRKGSRNNHTNGYAIIASKAIGQQKNNRISHNINVVILLPRKT